MHNETASEWVILIFSGTLFFTLLVGFIIYFIFMYRQKQLLFLAEQKRLKAEYEKNVAEAQIEIQEDILRYVSSEIHDNLGQIASLLKIHLFTFPIPDSDEGNEKLRESKELLTQLINDLKTLSLNLNTDYISENGFVQALQNQVERVNRTGILHVQLDTPAHRIALADEKEIFLFRMSQEIITNILKHAQASVLKIVISSSTDLLTLSFKDNGCGFDVEKMLSEGIKSQHSGLRNLQKRSKLIQADLKIHSEAQHGSEFIITLPL